ncbi:MAG: 50S ribosomal protein L19 [Candidatus Buchananbacteria bacterium RIFCSPHIGHO2_02_FULL_45_11b]|uniref:50S ribosomal protein L19 n=3 Tax=Candidatus Buchananiibacteriota TaxID=1817903 RepID=A0A1G1YKS0_9BACT|nr:MAG: 50S ribosomal protein L19 [Candidatus Buchananbacteria bacterium RIFCSPHIGHO2_02_FULL_45_11b]OGY53834.1 MAG: 50S ribosomal protein L19 [Candidatus Buchananbacteria bacterium RIFCSPLOWO2_01_FULL_45_31]OGY56140.1 MAG: 50S ribosomal protein L19 [Candidatus Buchananbacteria bacterium RIFCSPLOWO2_02_FULL_46_11b]
MAEKKVKKVDHEDKLAKKKIEKEPLPELKPGMTVKVHQLITELGPKGEKQRIQVFEGIILAHQHGLESGATITVRKISEGIGVEKIFPLHSPNVIKIEPVKQARVRKAKLYYLRDYGKRLKEKQLAK